MNAAPRRLVVGISGASGVVYGIRVLEALRPLGIETHLVMSKAAEVTLAHETRMKLAKVRDLATAWYKAEDIGAVAGHIDADRNRGRQPAHVFAALRERLRKRNSPYEAVFAALARLGKARPDAAIIERLLAEPDPEPDDLEALDVAWAEEEVLFGPGAAADDCGKDTLSAKLRQARRPAPGLEPVPGGGPRMTVTHSGNATRRGA